MLLRLNEKIFIAMLQNLVESPFRGVIVILRKKGDYIWNWMVNKYNLIRWSCVYTLLSISNTSVNFPFVSVDGRWFFKIWIVRYDVFLVTGRHKDSKGGVSDKVLWDTQVISAMQVMVMQQKGK